MEDNWNLIQNVHIYDTPFLAIYWDRIRENMREVLRLVGNNASRLRPHIKTHKTGEILDLFQEYGITKIKCATIAEAELAAIHGIADILLAYQPVGNKIKRWIDLIHKYPDSEFSCLVDDLSVASALSGVGNNEGVDLKVYIDINTGMNRTGYSDLNTLERFIKDVGTLSRLVLQGLHIYDGHLHDSDPGLRNIPANEKLQKIRSILRKDESLSHLIIVAGGTNTFSFYKGVSDVECSPGTFVFWDENYVNKIPELKFQIAALIVCSVISIPTTDTLCVDVGYKSVASENSLDKRIYFPWDEGLAPFAHSEEHLVLKNTSGRDYRIGDLLYATPYHICPTCALYEEVKVVEGNQISKTFKVRARDRKISV